MRDINSYFPIKNNFFIVPIIDKVSTAINMVIPEYSYNVIRQTGAYEPKIEVIYTNMVKYLKSLFELTV